jgi:hypothetical protein
MKPSLIVKLSLAVLAVGLILSRTFAQPQVYDTPLFSVQFPAGAEVRPVAVDRDSNSATHTYIAKLPQHSFANIYINDFDECCVEDKDHVEISFSKSRLQSHFAPGAFVSPITPATVGGVHGYQQTIRGQVSGGSGLPLILRWRIAVSKDRRHVWMLETTAPSDHELSEAASEAFFNSLRIK